MNVHLIYRRVLSRIRIILLGLAKKIEYKEKAIFVAEKTRLAGVPLVETSLLEFSGSKLLVITAQRKGLLRDMIAAAGIALPSPQWDEHCVYSYTERYSVDGKRCVKLEEAISHILYASKRNLPVCIFRAMIRSGFARQAPHYVDIEDCHVRVSDIFVGLRPRQWRQGGLHDTLYLSEFGPGTRIVLKAV